MVDFSVSNDVSELTLRDRAGTYVTGKARVAQILEAAYEVMIEQGIAAITLREIARRCGIRVGAVTYYYKSRADLIQDLIECSVAPYFTIYEGMVTDDTVVPVHRLARLVAAVLSDIQTQKTTSLFPELWATANRDGFVAELMDRIYARQRQSFERLIAMINPRLGARSRSVVALYVSASLEGQTMFVGFEKPNSGDLPDLTNVAVWSIVNLVSTITDMDIETLSDTTA